MAKTELVGLTTRCSAFLGHPADEHHLIGATTASARRAGDFQNPQMDIAHYTGFDKHICYNDCPVHDTVFRHHCPVSLSYIGTTIGL